MTGWTEALLVLVALLVALGVIRRGRLGRYPWGTGLAALVLALSGLGMWSGHLRRETAEEERLKENLPRIKQNEGYVTSETCRSCHPQAYASWHQSYHRTMTQPATPGTVLADLDNVTLGTWGHDYHFQRRGDEFWVTTDDPYIDENDPNPTSEPVDRQIFMTTGSHHFQVYWAQSSTGRPDLGLLFAYIINDKRFVPIEYVFIHPPDSGRLKMDWNMVCMRCHSTGGSPELDIDTRADGSPARSRVGELGIACEACHGPAGDHVAKHRGLVGRYGRWLLGPKGDDPTIVNPAKLPPARATDVCGRCHGVIVHDAAPWSHEGSTFVPGDVLADHQTNLVPTKNAKDYHVQTYMPDPDAFINSVAWEDGATKVNGREFSSMSSSACNDGGALSCLNCHSMHHSRPEDQLNRDGESDQACLKCHPTFKDRIAEHTHHAPGTPGAACYNCHMPNTSYGLLKATRNHLIDSPSVDTEIKTGRPNACNLCHLDKTLDWTSEHLKNWYDRPTTLPIPAQLKETATGPYYVLKGDANQRVLAGWHLGWKEAQAAAGDSWMAPYLIQMFDDPYPPLRFVASKALQKVEGFKDFVFDYLAPPDQIAREKAQALDRWRRLNEQAPARPGLLMLQGGRIDRPAYDRLLAERDNRPVRLEE